MSVGILIISHENIGHAILNTAKTIIGSIPCPVETISIDMDCDCDTQIKDIKTIANKLNCGDGLLILTDLFGATPSNIASAIDDKNSVLVSGLNLPMLIRVLNYYTLPLYELSDKAIGGGQDGIMAYYPNKINEAS